MTLITPPTQRQDGELNTYAYKMLSRDAARGGERQKRVLLKKENGLGHSWRPPQVHDRTDKTTEGMIAGLVGLALASSSPPAAVLFATAY